LGALDKNQRSQSLEAKDLIVFWGRNSRMVQGAG
jgi:hypothetical protein